MTYIMLLVTAFFASLQNIVSKEYNIKTKGKDIYLYTAVVAATAMIFFILTSGGSFEFNFHSAIYSAAFALCYLSAVVGMIKSIECGPLSVSSLINQCSLIIPTLYGVAILNEKLKIWGYIGIVLLFVSLFLVKPKNSGKAKITPKWFVWVNIGFVGNGMCSTVQKMQQLKFDGAYKNEFMIIALCICAVVMSVASLLGVKEKRDVKSIFKFAPIQGFANGVVNMLVMVLTALLPAAILFPVVLAGGITITFIVSVTVFKERLTACQLVGYMIGILSIVFMC